MDVVQQPVIEEELGIVMRMAQGERQALAELCARFERPLLAYLRLLARDVGLAEELLQDTLFAAWTGAHAYAGQASVQGWLFGIARRRAHDAMRRRSLRIVDDRGIDLMPSAEPDPADVVVVEADRREIADAVAHLAPIHQEVLVLTFVHELSYQDLAEVLGVPIGTVRSRLSNAKRALRAQLRPEDQNL